jgi:hypothetical protein
MSFSDSNRASLKYVAESEWGVTPTSPSMQDLNLTSESLTGNINTVTSDTIRDDRNISDIVTVGGGASGDISFEMRFADNDDFIEAALMGEWVESIASAGLATVSVSAAVIEADSSTLNNVVVGQFLRITTASAVVNDGDYRVVTVSTVAGTTRCTVADASTGVAATFTSEIFDADNGLVYGKMIRNGVINRSFTFEKEFADIGEYAVYEGLRVGSMSLSFESQAVLTGSFSFVGKGESTASTTIASAVVEASNNEIMNASGNVVRIWEGGEAVTGIVFNSFSIELNNNSREQTRIGSDQLAGVALGRCEVTGSLSAYFENSDLISKYANNVSSNFRLQTQDATGNALIVTLPRIKYTEFSTPIGGGNADIMQDGSYGAIVDTGGTYTIQIDALKA